MEKGSNRIGLIVVLSMLAGIGVMRTCDIIFGYKPLNSTCRIERLKHINAQLDNLAKNYFDRGYEDEKNQ